MSRKLLLFIIIVIAGYAAFKLFGSDEKPKATVSTESLAVSVVQPSEQTLHQRISATGMLIPREEIAVLTELSGVRVKELFVDVGDSVKKGQKLAVLDAESLELQARQLEAEYQKARDEYARIEPIKDSGAVSKLSVAEKRSAMEAAKARAEDAKLAVRRATITAPQAGVIYERRATLGQLVNASEPLFRIAQGSQIEAQLKVPEADMAQVRLKQPVTLSVTGSDQEWQGTVRLIAPQINANTRTASVRVAIEGENTLIVGSFVRGDILVGDTQGLALPATAIQEDSEGRFVWVVDAENKAARQAITLTSRQDNTVLVEGVQPEMRVIAKAGAFVKAGDVVSPIEPKAEAN
ncbi:MAG: efflux RND transporter periplasmic adaptor subunit [Azospirillum brasilense]|nr:MAG: efflux RND transporter periplasmic adaptor subunit [Azospirillum brasilense]